LPLTDYLIYLRLFKGSIVQINLYSVHLDENYWNDPEEFQPERHLSADGTTVIKSDRILPFGAGEFQFFLLEAA
jgi:cytochrome P450